VRDARERAADAQNFPRAPFRMDKIEPSRQQYEQQKEQLEIVRVEKLHRQPAI